MPIHLAPITRRRFLARSITAGAGLALSRSLFAGSKPTDESSWALLADTHLAADRGLVERGINMTDHFTTVSRELLDLAKNPAGVFITGDCAFNNGETADYATLADLLKPIRGGQMHVHLALGNHDNRERFWDAFEEEKAAKRPLKDRQVALLRTPRVNWFILDSLEQTRSTPGLLGREQLDWLATALDANPKKPALVLIHHNPGMDGGNLGLKDTLLLFEVIRPRKQVKAYIYGHTHNWNVEQDASGIHLINLPPVAYVFQPGEPSGWVHARMKDGGMRLELRCVDPAHKAHGQVVNLEWRA
jgi:3',5'-cyclic AMP phosphodiesterase CpdA